jgi:uncharacterized pyridoxamine 5'-phosphate oxidase family protein
MEFKEGKIIFLATPDTVTESEIVLEIGKYEDGFIITNKAVLIKKMTENDQLNLVPYNNLFIISTLNGQIENPSNISLGELVFDLNHFAIYGEVTNTEIIDLFNKTFLSKTDSEQTKKPRARKNRALLGGTTEL